jgi:threonine dehydrogenase-like Zn-dependent dehydrogenase
MMGSVLVIAAPRTVAFAEEDDRPLGPHELRLRTLFSGISAGTELTGYRGTNPYLHKRWDAERRLFVGGEQTHVAYPFNSWGYEEVGEIVELGAEVDRLAIGQRVYGTWGHRTSHIVAADYARQRILPPHVDPILGIFSQIGAIALNGVLDAQINLGETVAVFGLGVVGQLVAQLARLSGAQVIASDPIEERRALAQQLQRSNRGAPGAGPAAWRAQPARHSGGRDRRGDQESDRRTRRGCVYRIIRIHRGAA